VWNTAPLAGHLLNRHAPSSAFRERVRSPTPRDLQEADALASAAWDTAEFVPRRGRKLVGDAVRLPRLDLDGWHLVSGVSSSQCTEDLPHPTGKERRAVQAGDLVKLTFEMEIERTRRARQITSSASECG
jgi:hypothetical protein